ncbi:hypothetical protein GGQ91_002570 [Methylobacterium fujisawaense]|uniref:Lysozyme inhibitor LprI N-terminal domain-containing protein n=1 Tax=Methylobacterium fujisawaense TaxID=107400 RepID=A0ABR6DAR7_9HYPH|nr:hypothetical protein [Methylobacterium fujisawaense]MBA9063182.1 hypothetical protein [Methylobacterium fujisawaense]
MRTTLALAVIVLAGTAVAEPIPKFDVDKICRSAFRRSAVGSKDDQAVYERCMTKAQEAYDSVKGMWPQLYPDEQERCARAGTGTNPVGSYDSIAYCAKWALLEHKDGEKEREDEMRARQIQRKEFRY